MKKEKVINKRSVDSKLAINTPKNYQVTSDRLSSEGFNFANGGIYDSNSKLTDLKYWWFDTTAIVYKWYIHHPTTIYAFKRVFYGLISFLIGISILALITHSQISIDIFKPENYDNIVKQAGKEAADLVTLQRKEMFNYSENPFVFLRNFLYNLIPFIPKTRMVGFDWVLDGSDSIRVINREYETFYVFLGVTFRNNVGEFGESVMNIMALAIPISVGIGIPTIIIAYLIGIPLGIEAAKRNRKVSGSLINGSSTILNAIPALIIIILVYIFASSVLNGSTMYSTGRIETRILPAIASLLLYIPSIVLTTRRYVVDEMNSDYVKFALSQGFSKNKIFYIYIFRNAGIRIIRVFPGAILGMMLGISLIIEQQWKIPGMSSIIVGAATGTADPYVLLGIISFGAFITLISNILGDLILVWLDPRANLGKKRI